MDEREPNLHLGRSARGGRVKMMKNEIGCMWRGREGGRRDKKSGSSPGWFRAAFLSILNPTISLSFSNQTVTTDVQHSSKSR